MAFARLHFIVSACVLILFSWSDSAVARCKSTMIKEASAELHVSNQSSYAIHFVYLSPCGSERSFVDVLGPEEVILPGAQRAFDVDPGCWDLRGRLATGREFVFDSLLIEFESFVTATIRDE